MAEQDIVERLRSFNHISDAMPDAIDIIESLRDDNAGLFRRIAELDAENASLRQQLADARETAVEAAVSIMTNGTWNNTGYGRAVTACAVTAIRALSHPDREGERG